MAVDFYLSKRTGELRMKRIEERTGQTVLDGGISVEEAQARAVRRAGYEKGYGSVADYDPVLRSHCRLDGEG
ncbi:MAG TPA: hypothetical protein VGN17_17655 [Bryobacteraceae bacterium]